MNCVQYTSKNGNTLWLPTRWGADDARAVYLREKEEKK